MPKFRKKPVVEAILKLNQGAVDDLFYALDLAIRDRTLRIQVIPPGLSPGIATAIHDGNAETERFIAKFEALKLDLRRAAARAAQGNRISPRSAPAIKRGSAVGTSGFRVVFEGEA